MQSAGLRAMETPLAGVLLLEPKVFADERGFFLETYNQKTMAAVGIEATFVQDNHSFSRRNVVRGLHYQVGRIQGKLVRVIAGEIFDVALDLRQSSPSFGRWYGTRLSGENQRMLWVPEGLAHGFSVLSESAHVLYKATAFYDREGERTILWNDPELNIDWQLGGGAAILSPKDRAGVTFRDAPKFA
jgi:dTDP-4-dehydrorhamnose 3,5-epimerase